MSARIANSCHPAGEDFHVSLLLAVLRVSAQPLEDTEPRALQRERLPHQRRTVLFIETRPPFHKVVQSLECLFDGTSVVPVCEKASGDGSKFRMRDQHPVQIA